MFMPICYFWLWKRIFHTKEKGNLKLLVWILPVKISWWLSFKAAALHLLVSAASISFFRTVAKLMQWNMAQKELQGYNKKEDLAGKLWANVCYCILGPKAPGTALSHITGCTRLGYDNSRRIGPTGNRSPGWAPTLNPPHPPCGIDFCASYLSFSAVSQLLSLVHLAIPKRVSGSSLNAVLTYFSVDMTVAQHFCLQNRCPQKTDVLLLPFAVALRCVPAQVISGRWIPPESQCLCLTWQCGTCSALEQQLLLSCLVLASWWPHPISHCFTLQRSPLSCADLLNKGLLGPYSPAKHSSLIQINFWCH